MPRIHRLATLEFELSTQPLSQSPTDRQVQGVRARATLDHYSGGETMANTLRLELSRYFAKPTVDSQVSETHNHNVSGGARTKAHAREPRGWSPVLGGQAGGGKRPAAHARALACSCLLAVLARPTPPLTPVLGCHAPRARARDRVVVVVRDAPC